MQRLIGAVFFGSFALASVFAFGPREPVELTPRFNANDLPADLEDYLASQESGIEPDVAKRIIWAGVPDEQTELAIVYLHGYSATSEEIRPVPDRVAAALEANLYYARLAGHGKGGEAMATPTVQDWIDDTAEALAIGRRLGRRVVVIATSTGGTLAAEAARHPELSKQIDALVLISPNFAIRNRAAQILTWPFVRYWGPVLAGAERCFDTINPDHARYWTTCYPTVSVLPMAALAAHARGGSYDRAVQPALVMTSEKDQVISPDATRKVMSGWGGPVEQVSLTLGAGDDPYSHVLAGDILSPSMTGPVSEQIIDWIRALPH